MVRWLSALATRAHCLTLAALAAACSDSGQVLGPAATMTPSTLVSRVSAGHAHACAVTDGSVRCWGANDEGQLGIGSTQPQTRPVAIASERKFTSVSAGDAHTCALTDANEVYCWGANERGQLGLGTRTASARPALVALPGAAVQLSAEFTHTCAVLVTGELYCWGENFEGELGQDDAPPDVNNAADRLAPVLVPGGPYQSVDTGQGHTCAIGRDGALWCWGRNSDHESGPSEQVQWRRPEQLGDENDWLLVDGGQSHTCALRIDRSAWCWGRNTAQASDEGYPLGIAGAALVEAPARLDSDAQWLTLSSHTFHSCGVDTLHDLWCWGRNQEGQLGLDDIQSRPTPTLVQGAVASVATGHFFGCIVTLAGQVACAGANESGQLGTGDTARRQVFTPLSE